MNYFMISIFLAIKSSVLGETSESGLEDNRRIVGGQESEVLPFFVQLKIKDPSGTFYCGASLLTPNGAVTAAHCIHNSDEITAFFGSKKRFDGLSKKVFNWQFHRSYNPKVEANDVAVVLWKEPLTWSKDIQPITIGAHPKLGTKLEVAGFGQTQVKNGKDSPTLRSVSVELKDIGACKKNTANKESFFKSSPADSILCSHSLPYKGNYIGDSGGPLFIKSSKPVLVGISVKADGELGAGIYTSAKYYSKWIQDTMKCLMKHEKGQCVTS